ncbi:MAG: hypothetical protein SNI70_04245 [Rikenellaceae bacterium]
MGTIITICIIVGAIYYFKNKKKATSGATSSVNSGTASTVAAPSDRPATIRFTDDSEEEYNARKEKFAAMLQASPLLSDCYTKILGAFIPNNKKEFVGFFNPTEDDRAKLLKKTAITAMEELKYNTDDYVVWCKALYDDLLTRMNAKKIMKQSVAYVISDVQQGDEFLRSICDLEKILQSAGDGNKTEVITAEGDCYKFKFKEKHGELFFNVPSGVYSLFYAGVSFDSFQRCAEILIAICGIYKDPKYQMYFHQDIPSFNTFLSRQRDNGVTQ